MIGAYGPDAVPVPFRENLDVARAVAAGVVDRGVLPVENTLAGSVLATYDAIIANPEVQAIGEIVLSIHHCVLGVEGATLGTLRVVESHPVALAQCATFFDRHPDIHRRSAYDTAGAAEEVARANDVARGAIASAAAARRYRLAIVAANVEDRADNQTRFLLVSRVAPPLPNGHPARTILVVTAPNAPGALVRLLLPISDRGLNLSKLESRPTGEPWTYRFVLEFEHLANDPAAREAHDAIRATAAACHTIGTYVLPGQSHVTVPAAGSAQYPPGVP